MAYTSKVERREDQRDNAYQQWVRGLAATPTPVLEGYLVAIRERLSRESKRHHNVTARLERNIRTLEHTLAKRQQEGN